MSGNLIAFDKGNRRIDSDGRLHVKKSNISRAQVSPYFGAEIPEYQALGLDAKKVYMLLRDPKELEKAASTFNNLPLMSTHLVVNSEDLQKDYVIGSLSNTAFDGDFLTASLAIWDSEFIDSVMDETQAEISCGYRYKAKMEKGYFNGVAYDGIMTEIEANHVALVPKGRAGSEVRVAFDAANNLTVKGIIMDKAKALELLTAVATTDELKLALDVCMATDKPSGDDEGKANEAIIVKKDDDEDGEGKPAIIVKKDDDNDDDDEEKPKIGMDADEVAAAIQIAVDAAKVEFEAKAEAKETVKTLVGDVTGLDSAEAIYRFALDQNGIETSKLHASALKPMVDMLLSNANPVRKITAMDSETATEIKKAFPHINRLN